jgi:hypothetical protein
MTAEIFDAAREGIARAVHHSLLRKAAAADWQEFRNERTQTFVRWIQYLPFEQSSASGILLFY